MALTREQILAAQDIKVKAVDVPEWGGEVFIKQLTRGQQDTYLKSQYGSTKLKQNRKATQQEITDFALYGHDAQVVAWAVCDEDGTPIFKVSDVGALNEKNGEIIGSLASEIIEFSGMREDIEAAEELKIYR